MTWAKQIITLTSCIIISILMIQPEYMLLSSAQLNSQILFVAYEDDNLEIYTLNVEQMEILNITVSSANDSSPTWSPDGSQIAFVSDRDNSSTSYVFEDSPFANNDVFVMNADGSDVHNLTDGIGNNSFPAWSPDGSQLAFISDRDRQVTGEPFSGSSVFVMNADGSDVRSLTDSDGVDWLPTWSPDGNRIAYYTFEDNSMSIRIFDIGDANQIQISNGILGEEANISPVFVINNLMAWRPTTDN